MTNATRQTRKRTGALPPPSAGIALPPPTRFDSWRLAWLVELVAALALAAVLSPDIATGVQSVCFSSPCPAWQTPLPLAEWLAAQNVDLRLWATVVLAERWFVLLALGATAAWLLWRGPRRWTTLVLAWFAVAYGVVGFAGAANLAPLVVRVGAAAFAMIVSVGMPLGFALFPSDRWWRQWVRPVTVVAVGLGILEVIIGAAQPELAMVVSILSMIAMLILVVSVVLRWRRSPDANERRLVGLALAGAMICIVLPALLVSAVDLRASRLVPAVSQGIGLFFSAQVVWLMMLVGRATFTDSPAHDPEARRQSISPEASSQRSASRRH